MTVYLRTKRVKGRKVELKHCSWFTGSYCTRIHFGLNPYCDRSDTCKDKRILTYYTQLRKLKVI